MSINSFTMRISGIVAYTDGSQEPFGATYDSNNSDTTSYGIAVGGNKSRDRDIGRHLMFGLNQRSDINELLDLLTPADISVYTAGSPTESANPDVFAKMILSYDMHISGTITDSDGSTSIFDIEITPAGVKVDHAGSSGVNFYELANERTTFPHYWTAGNPSNSMLYYILQRYQIEIVSP